VAGWLSGCLSVPLRQLGLLQKHKKPYQVKVFSIFSLQEIKKTLPGQGIFNTPRPYGLPEKMHPSAQLPGPSRKIRKKKKKKREGQSKPNVFLRKTKLFH